MDFYCTTSASNFRVFRSTGHVVATSKIFKLRQFLSTSKGSLRIVLGQCRPSSKEAANLLTCFFEQKQLAFTCW